MAGIDSPSRKLRAALRDLVSRLEMCYAARLPKQEILAPWLPRDNQPDRLNQVHDRELSANRRVRSARSDNLEPSNPVTMLPTRSFNGLTQCPGNASVPCMAPNAEPAVAPLQSVSQPPRTAKPMVLV